MSRWINHEEFETELAEREQEIEEFKIRRDHASGEIRNVYDAELDALEADKQTLRMRLDEIRGLDEEMWDSVRSDVEHAWHEFEESWNRAKERLD